MNKIIITNGVCYVSKKYNKIEGAIIRTKSINKSFNYQSTILAEKEIKRATKKLNGYWVETINCNDIKLNNNNNSTKIKRKSFNKTTRQAIYHNANCHCQICGKLITFEEFTVDHIIPLANGGTNDMSNLQSSCLQCNKIKADILPDDFIQKIKDITLYQLNNNYDKQLVKSVIKIYFKNLLKGLDK